MNTALFLQLFVIRTVLLYLEPEIPYNLAAEKLILGTAAQESHLGGLVRKRIDLTMYQMKPKTEKDIWKNFLAHRSKLREKVRFLKYTTPVYYAAAMVRVHYFRYNVPSPEYSIMTVREMAHFWKYYYNTRTGRGKEGQFIKNYLEFVEGKIR